MKEDKRNKYIYEDNPNSVDVWVCQDWFPIGSYSKTRAGFPMNRLLKMQIDYLLKNVVDDWDFTLLICGEGEVRIGKSTLAQQISTYWVWSMFHLHGIKLPHSVKENMVFVGSELIKKGNKLGQNHKYSTLIFDEAGADLEGVKSMTQTTKAVRDYLRECGQYNMLNILVLPEYFDLPKGIALSRSIAMINVYWLPDKDGSFQRGYFKFYNKPDKKLLYLKGKKDLDYKVCQDTFYGTFPRFYTYNEKDYKKEKMQALKNREQMNTKESRQIQVLYACLCIWRELGKTTQQMADMINEKTFNIKISETFIRRFIKRTLATFNQKEDEWALDIEDEKEDEDE